MSDLPPMPTTGSLRALDTSADTSETPEVEAEPDAPEFASIPELPECEHPLESRRALEHEGNAVDYCGDCGFVARIAHEVRDPDNPDHADRDPADFPEPLSHDAADELVIKALTAEE